ncbi:MAG: hypothetical protein M0Q44_03760 [Methylobacter sp.]|jgi:hypothetical protein|nr:hypothetical protein [Methylobacter sp.]
MEINRQKNKATVSLNVRIVSGVAIFTEKALSRACAARDMSHLQMCVSLDSFFDDSHASVWIQTFKAVD